MATVVKTWTFTGDAEGFTEVGDSGVTLYYGSNQIYFSSGIATTASERARTGAGVTWETWGVPAGSTVTDVNATIYSQVLNGAGVINAGCAVNVLNSSNNAVHSAGAIISRTDLTGTATLTGTSRAVDASYQASTTAVKAQITGITGVWNDGEGELEDPIYLDTLALTITYTEAAASSLFRRVFNKLMRIGSRGKQ